MKKLLSLFIVLAFTCLSINAQTPWYLTGNSGTNPSSNFIGTTDNNPLIFKTRNIERMRLLTGGSFLGVGLPIPQATLHLHHQKDGSPPLVYKLLQLTTDETGNGGFCITYDNTKNILFKQQEAAKFFIEGPQGGFMISPAGKIGFGTEEPQEKVHVEGKLLIERTATTASSLQFRYTSPSKRDIYKPDSVSMGTHYWDIFSDTQGLKFNTVYQNGISTQNMIITSVGRVGIGVAAPLAILHVGGMLKTTNATIDVELSAGSATITNSLSAGSANITGTANANVIKAGSATITGTATANVLSAGNANISGTTTTNNMKITGLLCAKSVRVQLTGYPCWPDFVFSKDYKLPTLSEVEQFIAENQHLPNVPSAAEVMENGVELGEMNAILLQKVEELTLYILDLQKQINELKNQ